ncbi:LAFA_0A01310g1_1 [Lachancea sp. 'fantastica']|nr:LAFA_0A01310g1_1 [Lachancea sp. 'fantastica']
MDGVDDILNENQVADEEEDEDEELDEEMVDLAGRDENQDRDQEGEQDDQDNQDDQEDYPEQTQDQDQDDDDEDMDGEDDDNDDNDDMDDDNNNGEADLRRNRETGDSEEEEEEDDDDDDDGDDDEDQEQNEARRKNDNNDITSSAEARPNLGVSVETHQPSIRKPTSAFDKIHEYYIQLYNSAKLADVYSIYPTAAIPIQTHVHSIAMSKGLKYLFLGGEDGFIRKYDFLNTIEGKLSLTILQKHSLVESISNAGILLSYWENEVPQSRDNIKLLKSGKEYEPVVSPVHALEVQSECMFVLGGLENGGITMQGCRFMEGHIAHLFQKHTSTVNQLRLSNDESRFMSGGWDKQILEWDLQTGTCSNEFKGSTAQLSSLEFRPLYSTVDVGEKANLETGNEQEDAKKEDDDLDSLFGDEEEEERVKTQQKEDAGDTAPDNKSPEVTQTDEISKSTLKTVLDENVFLASCTNGAVQIWDRRISNRPVLNLSRGPQVPPWCMSACWSTDGDRVYAGRRNAIVEEFDLKMSSSPSKVLKFPSISGPVSCVRAMPNNKHVLCASNDNVRIYDVSQYGSSKVPFLIVPGHHGGMISNLYLDPTCRFLISTSGDKGWQGVSTDATLIYDIDVE